MSNTTDIDRPIRCANCQHWFKISIFGRRKIRRELNLGMVAHYEDKHVLYSRFTFDGVVTLSTPTDSPHVGWAR